MTPIMSLWLPIIVSTVFAFIASSLIHMVLPWHKGDYPQLPNQDAIMDALRPFNLAPGDYMLPRPGSMADMKTPEFKAKAERGPVLIMTVYKGMMDNMGKLLGQWFIYQLVVALFAAHIAGTLVGPGGDEQADLPLGVHRRVRRLRARALAADDLVSPVDADHAHEHVRRDHLLADRGADVRLALAALTTRDSGLGTRRGTRILRD